MPPSKRPADRVELSREDVIPALEARERFLAAILGSLEAFLAVDEDWRVTYANRAAAEGAGAAAGDLLGKELWAVVPDLLDEAERDSLRRAMTERVSAESETETPQGRAHHARAYPLADGGLAVYIQDVSERRRREAEREQLSAALVASEQRYRSIVETTAEGIMIGDPDGTIVFANQRMADMLGYTVDELVGMSGPRLVYPDWMPKVVENREALRHGEVLRGEFKLRRKDGSALWTVFSSTPVRDRTGGHVGNLTMHTDISERRASEEAVRESEETLRSFYDSAFLLMGVAELDGERIVPVSGNRAAEALLGDRLAVTPSDGEPRRPEGHGAAAGLERELVRRYLESEVARRPVRFEYQLDPDDDARLLSFTVAHIAGGTSGRPRFSFVAEDITERRRAEEALREPDREQAARAEKSRVARDLHDSVTQALFAASLKAEALAGLEDVSPDVEAVVAEVQRLNRGALAQMRTMLLELRGDPLEQIPLHQLVRNVVEATESRTRTRVGLTIEGDGQVPPVVHVTLYRVTQEALNNVARHAQADHAWVELSLLPGHARLTVKDDGRGFTPGPLGPAHLGLRSMRERAAEAGARLGIVTAPGEGAEISVEWEAEEQARPG
jgi:PAS domain S-box-containing protein